jgi:hypothetical protein
VVTRSGHRDVTVRSLKAVIRLEPVSVTLSVARA